MLPGILCNACTLIEQSYFVHIGIGLMFLHSIFSCSTLDSVCYHWIGSWVLCLLLKL